MPAVLLIPAVLCLDVPAVSGIELPTMFGRHAVLRLEEVACLGPGQGRGGG